ncbi:MAG: oligosaccharide flippase family protein [Planctomycetota bacterium]
MEEKQPGVVARWLVKSEKLFRTDMVYVFRSSFWMGISQAVASASTFLLAIALTFVLPIESYGSYKMIFTVMGVLQAFSLTQISVAVTRAAARGEDRALLTGFRSNLIWGLPKLILAAPVCAWCTTHGHRDIAWGIAFAVPGALLVQGIELYGPFLVGKKEFKLGSRLAVIQTLVASALIAASLFFTRNVVVIVAVYFGANVLTHIPIYAWVVRAFRVRESTSDGAAAVNYGWHLSLMRVLGTITFQLDNFLVGTLLGNSSLAVYSVAKAPPQQLRILGKNLSAISLPKLAERTPEDLKRLVPRKALVVLVFSIGLIAAYVLGAPYLYKWFFPKYLDSVTYSRWYSLLILSFPLVLFQNSLIAHRETRAQYVIETAIPIFKTILYIFLIPRFRLAGVVGCLLVTEVLHIVLVLIFFARMKPSPKPEVLPEVLPATESSL